MTITPSQSGFTDELGTSVSSVSDGDANTGWAFDLYADNTGKVIKFDMGGWFDASTMSRIHVVTPSTYLIGCGGFAMQLSADNSNWFNMPDATSSVNLGASNDLTQDFTPWPDGTNFRYVRLIGVGGAYDLPSWTKEHGYLSYLTRFTTIALLTGAGAALTVDTSGGANPSPPVGTPDTDDGAANPPAAPADSGVAANISNVNLSIIRSDPGEVRVSNAHMAVVRSDPGEVRVSSVSVAVMVRVPSDLVTTINDGATLTSNLTVVSDVDLATSFADEAALSADLTVLEPTLATSLIDDAKLTARLTVAAPVNLETRFNDLAEFSADLTVTGPPVDLATSFTDEAALRLNPLQVVPPTDLATSFTDEGQFSATIFAEPENRGPFYFAWVDSSEKVFNSSMIRDDEDIFSFKLSQNEGDFANLQLVIKNPRVGLLGPARKVWAWLSYYDGTTLKPLFFGRMVGIPSNIFDTRVTIDFTARPLDFAAQKDALAASLRVAPYFDSLFVTPDSWLDPDVVLEARSALWHIDRVTHQVTISDVIVPEDGTIELTEDDHLYAGLSTSLTQVPARRVLLTSNIPWKQTAAGSFSLTGRIQAAWPNVDIGGFGNLTASMVQSFTFDGLSGDWPRPGAKVGQGWEVITGSLIDQSGIAVPKVHIPNPFLVRGGFTDVGLTSNDFTILGSLIFQYDWSISGVPGTTTTTIVPMGWGVPELSVGFDSSRDYAETIIIDLEADMQSVVTLPGDDEVILLNVNANPASDVTLDGSTPLADARYSTFADTPRGQQAVEHLLMIARANLINRSRAVSVGVKMKDLVRSFDVTLRKALLVHDHRLPGGQAIGKITQYVLSYANGRPDASVTINCAVGYGGAVATSVGEDAYIDDDYVDDYYVRENVVNAVPSSDITYTIPNYEADDDGINFIRGLSDGNAVLGLQIANGPRAQQQALINMAGGSPDMDAYGVVLQQLPTEVHLTMLPIGKGPYITTVPIDVSTLIIPQQINLEADEVTS